jgi:hypothetical protein
MQPKTTLTDQAALANTYNPRYSRKQRSGGSQFEVSSGNWFLRPYLKKGLVEWLKYGS